MLEDGVLQFRGVYHPASQETDAPMSLAVRPAGFFWNPLPLFFFSCWVALGTVWLVQGPRADDFAQVRSMGLLHVSGSSTSQ